MTKREALIERMEKLLDIYTTDEVLEYNDMEPAEALAHLYTLGFIELPVEPL